MSPTLIPEAASFVAAIIYAYGVFLASSKALSSASFYALACAALSSSSSSLTNLSCSYSASANYYCFRTVFSCFSSASFSGAVAISIILPKIP